MIEMHRLISLFILGLIEGLTEFLPISSTGHMILAGNLLGYIDDSVKIFTIIIQFGAILAVTVIFRSQLYYMSTTCLIDLFVKQHYDKKHLCIHHIFIGTIPGIVLGTVFYKKISLIFEPIYVMYGLITGGIFLLIGELYISKKPLISNINDITYLQAFLIGCFQCLAFCPGFSRSGATIAGGLLVGLNRRISTEFSFFLAIPIILGATILIFYRYRFDINAIDILLLFGGGIIAFVIAFFTVRFFLKIIQKITLIPFIIYRFLLAGSIYWGLIV